jgi:hypothetical protein
MFGIILHACPKWYIMVEQNKRLRRSTMILSGREIKERLGKDLFIEPYNEKQLKYTYTYFFALMFDIN